MVGVNRALEDFLKTILPEDHILLKEPMDRHTTFRTGGPVDCLVTVDTQEQLSETLSYLRKTGCNFFLLGNGSNLLVGDKGYRGVAVRLGKEFAGIRVRGERLEAGAGAALGAAAAAAWEAGLSGLEFASGIPGTIGGAVRMNAGAYGGEMAQIVETVRVMTPEGRILTLDKEAMEFCYRGSIVRRQPYVVLQTCMRLKAGEKEAIGGRMQELSRRRREKQPLEFPSAGSTFKRPEGHYAGKLIMDAGLAGKSCGGARISEKHCGFIINADHARAADIVMLIEETQRTVRDKFGITLEPEVILLGDF